MNQEAQSDELTQRDQQCIDHRLDNYVSPMELAMQTDREDLFSEDEDLTKRCWSIPKDLHNELRRYSIREAGTPQHMGQVATQAMLLELRANSDNQDWMMHKRLREAYQDDFAASDLDTQVYDSPPTGRDYSDYDSVDKQGFTFSAPAAIVNQFTGHLGGREYGEVLASALDRYLTLQKQLDLMHTTLTRIEKEEEERNEAIKKRLNKGDVSDINDLEMDDTDVELPWDEDFDYSAHVKATQSARQPVVLALLRGRRLTPKATVMMTSEMAGGGSKPTQRKDWRAIVKHLVEDAPEDEPLYASPGAVICHKLSDVEGETVFNLFDYAKLDSKWCPLWRDIDEQCDEWSNAPQLAQGVADNRHLSEVEEWSSCISDLADLAVKVIETRPVKECGTTDLKKSTEWLDNAEDTVLKMMDAAEDYIKNEMDENLADELEQVLEVASSRISTTDKSFRNEEKSIVESKSMAGEGYDHTNTDNDIIAFTI